MSDLIETIRVARSIADLNRNPSNGMGPGLAIEELITELEARDAVIAEARSAAERSLGKSVWRTLDAVTIALRRVPADALAAVREATWDECARATELADFEHDPNRPANPYRTTEAEGATP